MQEEQQRLEADKPKFVVNAYGIRTEVKPPKAPQEEVKTQKKTGKKKGKQNKQNEPEEKKVEATKFEPMKNMT